MGEMDELLSQFSPEELAELIGLGTLDERGALLQDQMAQAQALRQPQAGHHTTGMGAALGGLGDVVRGFAGARQTTALGAQQAELLGQKDKGREMFLRALRQRGQVGPAAPPTLDLSQA